MGSISSDATGPTFAQHEVDWFADISGGDSMGRILRAVTRSAYLGERRESQ